MCGLFGIYSSKINIYHKKIAKKSLGEIKHRGPDEQNLKEFSNSILCHSRLSIIDIKNGQQPLTEFKNRYTIIFNGEITNFLYLKKFLKNNYNVNFKTNSDTEVLLNLYVIFKEKCLNYIQGMFAFVIYDNYKKEIFLTRDHIGIKPIYYYVKKKNEIYFSSEIKAFYNLKIKKFKINKKKIDEFIIHGNIIGKETLHKNINQVKPGTYLKISENKIIEKKYWDPFTNNSLINKKNFNVISNTKQKLFNVFKEWFISDVKIACLTSGGLDSGIISSIIKKFKKNVIFVTSYTNEKEQDERNLAKSIIGSKSKHKFLFVSDKNLSSNFLKIIKHTCEPIHNLNTITFYELCKNIKKKYKIKVLMTGEGSDECLGGYNRHKVFAEDLKKKKINIKDVLMSMNYLTIKRFKQFKLKKKFDYRLSKERLLMGVKKNLNDPLNFVLGIDQKTFLPPYLNRMDMIGGMFGMEVRSPFLDKRLIEYFNNIPMSLKIRKYKNYTWKKFILRKVAKNLLPKKIVWNKKKYQFNAPAALSLKNGSMSKLFKLHINNRSEIKNIYNIQNIIKLFDDHESSREGQRDHSNTLIRILSLEIFLKHLKKYA